MNVFHFAAQMNAGALVYVVSQYNWIQGSGDYIKYNGKKYDRGNNYDTTTYKYTAPLTGQYLVTSNLYTSTNKAHQEIQINGVGFTRSYRYVPDTGSWLGSEPTLVLEMNAGDKLSVLPMFGADGVIGGSDGTYMTTWLSVSLLYVA